jgi:hypothetical protein
MLARNKPIAVLVTGYAIKLAFGVDVGHGRSGYCAVYS